MKEKAIAAKHQYSKCVIEPYQVIQASARQRQVTGQEANCEEGRSVALDTDVGVTKQIMSTL